MIIIEDLHKSFKDNYVLRGVNLKIEKGKTTVILGKSGCGKTVLVKHIIGLMKPDKGKIYVDGQEITSLKGTALTKVIKKFGMLFQGTALFDSMTVEENIAFPLVEHTDLSYDKIRRLVLEKLKVVGLEGVENKYPSELSGGMKKRVGFARAMALDPEYIIFDEPTTGLDPITAASIDKLMIETQRKYGLTFIVITHDIQSTLRIAHKIALLDSGEIVEEGTPSEIIKSPNPTMREFVALRMGEK